jgi:hypothetical protein
VNTKPELSIKKILVTSQRFTAHNTKPREGKGYVSFHFEDNRKDCLCELSNTICWQASLTMKAVSSTGDKPDHTKDLLLMEAIISIDAEFSIGSLDSTNTLQSLAWYFDEVCKQKLLNKMKLLLLDTEFANISMPSQG